MKIIGATSIACLMPFNAICADLPIVGVKEDKSGCNFHHQRGNETHCYPGADLRLFPEGSYSPAVNAMIFKAGKCEGELVKTSAGREAPATGYVCIGRFTTFDLAERLTDESQSLRKAVKALDSKVDKEFYANVKALPGAIANDPNFRSLIAALIKAETQALRDELERLRKRVEAAIPKDQ